MDDAAGPLRVLVVEDQLVVALEIEAILTSLGWKTVGPAATLEKALDLVRTEPLDGAVLDINLNGTLVYPVAYALVDRAVPFAFVTGYGPHLAPPEPLRSAPRLQKPFGPKALTNLLTRAFKR